MRFGREAKLQGSFCQTKLPNSFILKDRAVAACQCNFGVYWRRRDPLKRETNEEATWARIPGDRMDRSLVRIK